MTTILDDPNPEIFPADEAADIARDLIARQYEYLELADIRCLFTTRTRKKNGRLIYGTAQKTTALIRFLSGGADFILLFGVLEWQTLNPWQRRALVAHELHHCWGVPGEWRIRGHDVEEFAAIVREYGPWDQTLRDLADAFDEAPDLVPAAPHHANGHANGNGRG